jgi:hypothetical protein
MIETSEAPLSPNSGLCFQIDKLFVRRWQIRKPRLRGDARRNAIGNLDDLSDANDYRVRENEGFAGSQAKMNVSVRAPIPFRMTIGDEPADMGNDERLRRIGVDEPRGGVARCNAPPALPAPRLCVPCTQRKHP